MQGCDMRRLFVSISCGALIELGHIGRSEKRPGLLWGSHGGPLGPSWAVVRPLGPSWGSFGPSWGRFRRLEGLLGLFWDSREAVSGPSGRHRGPA